MFVDAQVLSMKVSCSGSRSCWLSSHSSRRFRMSGRSCSVACAVFFARDPAPRDEPPYRAKRDLGAATGQRRLQFGQGNVGSRFVSIQDQPGMRLNSHRTSIVALLLSCRRSVLVCKLLPPDGARGADTEPYRRLSRRQITRDCRHNPVSKIH
jgi:hypothetical protein